MAASPHGSFSLLSVSLIAAGLDYCDQQAPTHSRRGETEQRRPRQQEHGDPLGAPLKLSRLKMPAECPVWFISLPRKYSRVVKVLLVSEISASTQHLFLPDKQPASNHSAAFTEGTKDKKEWIVTDGSLDRTAGLVDRGRQQSEAGLD